MAIVKSQIGYDAASGSNLNGGFYDITDPGTDYSQATSPILTAADGVTNGTTNLNFPSGGVSAAAAALVGNGAYLSTGGGIWRQITAYVDDNNLTMDAAVGADTVITVNVGGAFALPTTAIDNLFPAGSRRNVKSGTYTLTADWAPTIDGTAALPQRFIGFNATRGDTPTGTNRPLFAAGAFKMYPIGSEYWYHANIRITSTNTTTCFETGPYSKIQNVRAEFTTTGNSPVIKAGSASEVIDCEATAPSATTLGYCFTGVNDNVHFAGCYAHDYPSGGGFSTSNANTINASVMDTLSYGIVFAGTTPSGQSNTFYNCTVQAIFFNNQTVTGLVYNIFHSCLEGLSASTQYYYLDWNNWYNNTTDINAGNPSEMGDNTTSINPLLADPANGDFEVTETALLITNNIGSSFYPGAVQTSNGGGSQTAYGGFN